MATTKKITLLLSNSIPKVLLLGTILQPHDGLKLKTTTFWGSFLVEKGSLESQQFRQQLFPQSTTKSAHFLTFIKKIFFFLLSSFFRRHFFDFFIFAQFWSELSLFCTEKRFFPFKTVSESVVLFQKCLCLIAATHFFHNLI